MLSDREIDEYFEKHNLCASAREYINLARNSEPARLVGTNAHRNVCTWFVSSKMARTIQAESRTAEYAFALEYEYSDRIFEYWDQPPPEMIRRTNKNGTKRTGAYTADYLLLDKIKGPAIIEVKPENELANLIEKTPSDWVCNAEGFVYIPAKERFSELGLEHVVHSTKQLNSIRTSNLRVLLQSRNSDNLVTPELISRVNKIFKKHACLRLADLAEYLCLDDITPLVQLIEREKLVTLLSDELISQPESCWVAQSEAILDIQKEIKVNNNTMGIEKDTVMHIEKIPGEAEAEIILKKLERIKNGENSRSVRRWKSEIRKGKDKGLTEFQSLISKNHKKGNKTPRLNSLVSNYLVEFIEEHVSSPRRLLPRKAYITYKTYAEDIHPNYKPVSHTTFSAYRYKANQVKIARGRGGRRAANAAESPSKVEDREIKATLPFEIATMDHYQADEMCILAITNNKIYAARPWISGLVDIYSKTVLAIWISFRAPSSRSCAMVIRQCVRLHNRLPGEIIVDRGPDFESVYFHALLASIGISKISRPSEHGRFGADIERIFRDFKTQWLNLRPGNTADFKERRAVSSTHSPENTAELSVEKFLSEALLYVDWRNNNIIGNDYTSPVIKLKEGVERFNFIGRQVTEDKQFIIESAVDTEKYKVDPARGINIDGIHYWDPALSKLASRRRPAEVRLEPEDPYRIYAKVNDEWVTCFSSGEQTFQSKDPVFQHADAIRILDGRKLRDEAKEDGDKIFIRKLRKNDELQINNFEGKDEEIKRSYVNEPKITSIFTKFKDIELDKLDVTKWGEE